MFHVRYILRLSRRGTFLRTYASAQNDVEPSEETSKTKPEKCKNNAKAHYISLLEKYENKIQFNSDLEALKIKFGPMKLHIIQAKEAASLRRKDYELKKLPPLPIALQYVVDKDRLLKDPEDEDSIQEEPSVPVFLPYSKAVKVHYTEEEEEEPKRKLYDKSDIDSWMTNYDYFDDSKLRRSNEDDDDIDEDELDFEWTKHYGTPDPSERITRVQCGGCGAFLHCTDPGVPGYIPSEILKDRTEREMKTIECQRCHFLKQYNIALNVNVDPGEYEKLLSTIEHRRALVILMVDLLDFPCSIWPGIVDIIGTRRPLVIVGNKVDLVPGDGVGYLQRIRDSLMDELKKSPLGDANIKAVSLVSAKTGYGVEELISVLFKNWLYKGDVFLIGCTNVGKSSLFNKLLQSDYCKVHAVDLVQRATVSRWPGTTLNLLKFPMNRPSGWKIYTRSKRLKAEANLLKAEGELEESKNLNSSKLPSLIGHIGRSFTDPTRDESDANDLFSYSSAPGMLGNKFVPHSGINENDKMFKDSRWFYDTPGVVHPEQILSLLTAEELLLVLPKRTIVPRSFYLHAGHSLFIAGIARIDLVECEFATRFTVFASNGLPITTTKIVDADEVYENFLGTELFKVPRGGDERLSQWPGLAQKENLEFTGTGNKECCGDVVLSSAGWISVTAPEGVTVKVTAWTPEARGIHVRTPSLLPKGVMLKGKRIWGTPAYRKGRIYVPDSREPV